MYAAYFGLGQEPFSIAPDPRYLYMSERHREALAHLLYGLGAGGGFVLLSGEIGTGKTTVCRLFLEQIPANCNVAYIFNPKLTVVELLQSICDEFHIDVAAGDHPPTVKDYLDPLNEFLLREHAAGRNNVLIIDEAQNLSAEVLEQLRLLTNLETSERKLLQIILIGQPELRAMLARPELEQLAQRVIARFHLDAMTAPETAEYIQHRLEVAGLSRPLPFDRRALRRIHQLARGVPRRVNLLCDRALLGAFASGQALADRRGTLRRGESVARRAAAGHRRRDAASLGERRARGAARFEQSGIAGGRDRSRRCSGDERAGVIACGATAGTPRERGRCLARARQELAGRTAARHGALRSRAATRAAVLHALAEPAAHSRTGPARHPHAGRRERRAALRVADGADAGHGDAARRRYRADGHLGRAGRALARHLFDTVEEPAGVHDARRAGAGHARLDGRGARQGDGRACPGSASHRRCIAAHPAQVLPDGTRSRGRWPAGTHDVHATQSRRGHRRAAPAHRTLTCPTSSTP
jgi:type II secretory pathway predicted ATPase ExeA